MTSIDFKQMLRSQKMNKDFNSKIDDNLSDDTKEEKPNKSEGKTITILEESDSEISYFHDKLKQWKVGDVVPNMYYIPNFVTTEMEEKLLEEIYNVESGWVELKRRRLQNWGGSPMPQGMVQESLPIWLRSICSDLTSFGIFPIEPNHVLINEYKQDEGISFHKDGPLYFPRVAILSLLGTIKLDFKEKLQGDVKASVLLEPKSLLVFEDEAYKQYYHGIQEQLYDKIDNTVVNRADLSLSSTFERTVRISLTIRVVSKVLQAL